jgi:hypothetical protein
LCGITSGLSHLLFNLHFMNSSTVAWFAACFKIFRNSLL